MKSLELFNLSGKTALVTGCNAGIGQGMAVALAEAGADVVGAARSSDAPETRKKVESLGRKLPTTR
jgi:2-deoxy-D-gluconate 3-dehydrogenase